MDSRNVISALIAAGWREADHKGSHVQFKHETIPGRVTLPPPNRQLPLEVLRSIEKRSGLKLR
jgi:predicted RNA binding protein YcfA (HicA-like mRNA interferase family)